jgi:catechol 2,3-dioxygenase-like lactoylglutathione lyase family enzyme
MTMLDHISIGVRDIDRARKFYDATLEPLGYSCLSQDSGSLGYGSDRTEFWISLAASPVPADTKPGLHFCFVAPTRAAVVAFHSAALRKGGADNGEPGLRPDYGDSYYAAFAVDPDGYRIEAYCNAKS